MSYYRLERTDAEIDALIGEVDQRVSEGRLLCGMSYEDGVKAGIEWVVGVTDDEPFEEE